MYSENKKRDSGKWSKIFVVNHFLSAKVLPEWRINPGFGTQKKCPFPLNRGVPSTEVRNKYKNHVNIFLGPNFVSLEWTCPLNRDVPNEGFHCNRKAGNEVLN